MQGNAGNGSCREYRAAVADVLDISHRDDKHMKFSKELKVVQSMPVL